VPRKPKKPEPDKERSPGAKALADPKFRPQVVRDPRHYRRKQKHKDALDKAPD